MNRNITRGLAVAALVGGFTFLGATAANAIDIGDGILGDDGGVLGTGLLGDTTTTNGGLPVAVTLPVDVSGVDVGVLDGALSNTQTGGILPDGALGDGVVVTVDQAATDLLAAAGTGDNEVLHSLVGVPVDLSGSFASVLGNPSTGGANGVVAAPELVADPFVWTNGILDAFIYAPIRISCVTVTILSDFFRDGCEAGTPEGGSGAGSDGVLDLSELLGADILGDGVLDLDDLLEIDGILDGDILGDGVLDLDEVLEIDGLLNGDLLDGDLGLGDDVLGGDVLRTNALDDGVVSDDVVTTDDGVLVDPFDSGSTTGADAGDAVVTAPVDFSRTWASAFGTNGGIVIVPDLGTSPAALFGDELLARLPISINCASIVILSDYERDCAGTPVDPTDPTDPVDPTAPPVSSTPEQPTVSDEFHVADNGGMGDVGGENAAGAPCIPADSTAAVDEGIDLGMIGAAALAGALAALAMVALTRRFSTAK